MTPSAAIAIDHETEQKTQALTTLESGKALTVKDNETYLAGAELRKAVKALDKKADEFFKPLKQKQDEAKKALLDAEKSVRGPLQQALEIIDGKLKTYEREQEKKRQEEEKRLQEEARKQAEEEAITIAAQLEAEGDKTTAEAVLSAPVETPHVVVGSFVPKVAGLGRRENWVAQVTNLQALVAAVAAGTQPITLLQPNQTALNGMARSLKGAMKVPGVRVYDASK